VLNPERRDVEIIVAVDQLIFGVKQRVAKLAANSFGCPSVFAILPENMRGGDGQDAVRKLDEKGSAIP